MYCELTIGERLTDLRMNLPREKGRAVSQLKLAKKLGLSEIAIAHYEMDSRKPTFKALKAYAEFFKVSSDYLLGNTEYKTLDEYAIHFSARHERVGDKYSLEIYRAVSECYLSFETYYYEKYAYPEYTDEKIFPTMCKIIHNHLKNKISCYSLLSDNLEVCNIRTYEDLQKTIREYLNNEKATCINGEIVDELINLSQV